MFSLVGFMFIGLGVLFVVFGIYFFISFSEEFMLDVEFEVFVLSEVMFLISGENIVISGIVFDYDDVFMYINDIKIGSMKVDGDNEFMFEYMVEGEGDYVVNVVGVKGFFNSVIGLSSEIKMVKVDWMVLMEEFVLFKYGEEINKDIFIIVGIVEFLSMVMVKSGIFSYDVLVNEDGEFSLEGIEFEEGSNVFIMFVKDVVGNEIILEEKISVIYFFGGFVNGDVVVDGNIF